MLSNTQSAQPQGYDWQSQQQQQSWWPQQQQQQQLGIPWSPGTLNAMNQPAAQNGSYFPGMGSPAASSPQVNSSTPGFQGRGFDAASVAQFGNVPKSSAAMQAGALAGTAGASGAKPIWAGIPIKDMTGEQYKAFVADNQPSNAGAIAGVALQGVNMAGQLGMGIASMIQSQQAFDKQMGMADKNYAASIKAYNNSLEDKIMGRNTMKQRKNRAGAIKDEIESKSQIA
jgi:hypothetical protein